MSRSRKHRSSHRPHHPASRPFRSVESRLTQADLLAVEASAAAELRGDWATAFERHRAVPLFSQSEHGGRLQLMAALGGEAPDWILARFLTTLVKRWEAYGQPRRAGQVLRHVVPVIYPEGVMLETIGCEHVEQVPAWIFARDWVLRQADVFDLGGLQDLVDLPDAAPAIARFVHARAWCRAPMGGWRVVGAEGDVMVVADAATGREVELLDLGLTSQHEVGTHVLGRIVPTTVAPGRLFDWRPLPVDEETASAVARQPERWLRILGGRVARRSMPEAFSHLSDSSVSADLPRHAWGALLGNPVDAELPRPPWCLAVDALRAALTLAGDADGLRRGRHLVAELLLDEALDDATVARFVAPQYRRSWESLAAELPPYAARRCHEAVWLLDAVPGRELSA